MFFKLIFIVIFLVFFGLFILVSFGFRIYRFLFRGGDHSNSNQTFQSPTDESTKRKTNEKIIGKNEGEYVDFEEIEE